MTSRISIVPTSRARSVRQLRDAGEQEPVDVAARLQVAQRHQGVEQGMHLGARDLASAVEEIVLAEEVVRLLYILRLLAAGRDQNANRVGAIAVVVEILDTLALRGEHPLDHV